jgi:KaiC/GvpD/RAD55 family RecA-like ATPase
MIYVFADKVTQKSANYYHFANQSAKKQAKVLHYITFAHSIESALRQQ